MTWEATKAQYEALRTATIAITGQRYCTHGRHLVSAKGGVFRKVNRTARWICASCYAKRRG